MLTAKRFTGDYTIESTDNGTITLGTGTDPVAIPGSLTITNDLTVNGTTTTVNSANLAITDNIIVINDGEAGSEVTLGSAGITVDRGSGTDAQLLFVENTADGDIWVLDQGTGTQVKIVTTSVGSGSPINIVDDTSPQLGGNLDVNTRSITATTNVNVPILTAAGTGDITLTTNSTGDIVLTTANTGAIRFDGPAVVSGPAPSTTPAAGDVALYQAADSGGGTQIHFENDTETGELVSKTKALVYGLIL